MIEDHGLMRISKQITYTKMETKSLNQHSLIKAAISRYGAIHTLKMRYQATVKENRINLRKEYSVAVLFILAFMLSLFLAVNGRINEITPVLVAIVASLAIWQVHFNHMMITRLKSLQKTRYEGLLSDFERDLADIHKQIEENEKRNKE